MHLKNASPFKHGHFWVSMLNFRGGGQKHLHLPNDATKEKKILLSILLV